MLKQLIISRPDGDSLYAMVDTLNEININKYCLKIKTKYIYERSKSLSK